LWAHGRYRDEYEFGLHRHERLEILTVVVEGTISHYDTATGRWADLRAGDAQMMWSGTGISHIERAARGTRGFQIQFDPGQDVASRQTPSYQDYPATSFTAHRSGDALVTDLVGGGGPIKARTEGLSVRRIFLPAGAGAEVQVGSGRFTLAYLIDGAAAVNGADAASDDVISLNGASAMTVVATAPTDLLVLSVPASPSYPPLRFDPQEMARRGAPGAPPMGPPMGRPATS
jgi:quercetin 2,3-dioxygenase